MLCGALGNCQGGSNCCSALWLYVEGGFREGTVPLPGFWGVAQHLPYFQLPHPLPLCGWHFSSCYPGIECQSGWVCICFKTMRALWALFSENLSVSATVPTPTGFYSQKLWGFIFPVLEPLAVQSCLGLGSLTSEVSLPNFIHHMWTWDCTSPCHCHRHCHLSTHTMTPCLSTPSLYLRPSYSPG